VSGETEKSTGQARQPCQFGSSLISRAFVTFSGIESLTGDGSFSSFQKSPLRDCAEGIFNIVARAMGENFSSVII